MFSGVDEGTFEWQMIEYWLKTEMTMKTLVFIMVFFLAVSCDPEQTVSFRVDNRTSNDSEMTLYAKGTIHSSFRIEKQASVVIFTDSGLSPQSFQVGDYDSIKFSFTNGKSIVFANDTLNSPNDIYNGANWLVENSGYTQIFTYSIGILMVEE